MCASSKSFILLIGFLLLLNWSCKKKPTIAPSSAENLKTIAPFPMGSAVASNGIQNNYYYQGTLLNEYNSITADYEMKFDITEPQQGTFNYTQGDYIVGFAKQHHLRMHGHNFIWHQALPAWVVNFRGDSLAWENLFKTHIETEATHYKGEVASWDVVNEALRDDDGTLRNKDVNPED